MAQDSALTRAYLENIIAAMANEQPHKAAILAQHALELLESVQQFPLSSPFTYGVGLDTGIVRADRPNEDYAFATQFICKHQASPVPGGLFLVADGMGGHTNGAEAAHLAIHTFVDWILPQLVDGSLQEEALPSLLAQGVQRANQAIYEQNMVQGGTRANMGTTFSVAVLLGMRLYVANVGDSRTYIRQGGLLRQITRDHSVVADLVAKGDIRPEAIYTHPDRSYIYRCLGTQAEVVVDLFQEEVQDGDTVLVCSDGLWEMIPEIRRIEEVLSSLALGAEHKASCLVQRARAGGGADNISAIVVQIHIPDIQDMPTLLIPSPTLLSEVFVASPLL